MRFPPVAKCKGQATKLSEASVEFADEALA